MELVYAREAQALKGGQAQRNPRYFTQPEDGVSRVVLVGDWPEIEDAYLARGVAVSHHGRPELDRKPAAIGPITKQAEDPASIVIPDDWQSLPWSQKGRGTSLRTLAAAICPDPIINKPQAFAAITAELARRALDEPQPEAGGLTLREVHADLEAAQIAFDPGASVADKFALLTGV